MKYSMAGQEQGDILIQVTTWTGLTFNITYRYTNYIRMIRYAKLSNLMMKEQRLHANVIYSI